MRSAWFYSSILLTAFCVACDADDVTISGYRPLDVGAPSESLDADPVGSPDAGLIVDAAVLPDVVPFDALPVTEPEAPSAPLLAEIRQVQGRFALHVRNLVNGGAVTHGGDERMPGSALMRLLVVAVYFQQTTAGTLSPELEVDFPLDAYRAGGSEDLAESAAGTRFAVSRLASLTLLSGDTTAEELLVLALGGSAAINRFIGTLSLPGIGRYLSPCEIDRAYAVALDPRFESVTCRSLAKYLREEDARGITPMPFAEVPAFTELQQSDAWTTVAAAEGNTVTVSAYGEVLARLHGRDLGGREPSIALRALLDRSLGAGGGGNDLPDAVWVSNLQGSTFRGRAWAALVRGGDAPVALVLIADGAQSPNGLGTRFDRAAALAWEQIVGPIDLTPPGMASDWPDWLEGVFLHEPSEVSDCNREFGSDFDRLLACRAETSRERFVIDEAPAATVMVRNGPAVEATWLWTEPDALRHRYQVRLEAGGWWAWTRSYPAQKAGDWRLDIWLNGRPVLLSNFPVEGASAP